MMTRPSIPTKFVFGLGLAVGVALSLMGAGSARSSAADAIPIDDDDIAGVVTGAAGPEAGVWVIAETTDLPTRFVRIVVTDDRGRYVVPDLPKAGYDVFSKALADAGVQVVATATIVCGSNARCNVSMRVIPADATRALAWLTTMSSA